MGRGCDAMRFTRYGQELSEGTKRIVLLSSIVAMAKKCRVRRLR